MERLSQAFECLAVGAQRLTERAEQGAYARRLGPGGAQEAFVAAVGGE